MTAAVVGRPFALARDPALWPLTTAMMPLAGAGTISVDNGVGEGVTLPLPSQLAAQLPLSPVHARVRHDGDGSITVNWVRRSRTGFGWTDALDAPLDQREEQYVVVLGEGASASDVIVAAPQYRIESALLLPWQADGKVMLSIRQRGDAGLSLPLMLLVPLA